MGIIRTIKGEDGKPYISLEDFIKEVENVRNSNITINKDIKTNFIDVVLTTLHQMETEWYNRYLFRKDDSDN